MIKTDVDKKPIPQIYNPVNDEYEVLQGANGAARHIIYGTDGQPVSTPGNKLAIRASEIETQLTAIQGYIDGLEGAIGEAQAAPTANTLLARLKNLETKVDAIIADGIKLSGSTVEQVTLLNAVTTATSIETNMSSQSGCRGVILEVSGTFVADIYLYGKFVPQSSVMSDVIAYPLGGKNVPTNVIQDKGLFYVPTAGLVALTISVHNYKSGEITVKARFADNIPFTDIKGVRIMTAFNALEIRNTAPKVYSFMAGLGQSILLEVTNTLKSGGNPVNVTLSIGQTGLGDYQNYNGENNALSVGACTRRLFDGTDWTMLRKIPPLQNNYIGAVCGSVPDSGSLTVYAFLKGDN